MAKYKLTKLTERIYMMTFAERLAFLRKKAGINQSELAKKIGVTSGQVSKYERGLSEPRPDILSKIAFVLSAQIDDLIPHKNNFNPEILNDSGLIEVNELVEGVTSNKDNAIIVHPLKKLINVGKNTLSSLNINPKNVVCITVQGNSMLPLFSNGTLVAVDTASTHVIDGDIYAISMDGLLRIKQLYRIPGNKVRLRSFNRDEYEDEEYSLDDLNIIGAIFWYSSILTPTHNLTMSYLG